jgi:hypothetical protein
LDFDHAARFESAGRRGEVRLLDEEIAADVAGAGICAGMVLGRTESVFGGLFELLEGSYAFKADEGT